LYRYTTARQTQFSAAVMTEMGLDVLEIHSRRSAGERVAASDTFRLNGKQIMLSSDVSARGVDYPDVTAVLQVGLYKLNAPDPWRESAWFQPLSL
jgi:ATP-dependent RNA helicase MSS116